MTYITTNVQIKRRLSTAGKSSPTSDEHRHSRHRSSSIRLQLPTDLCLNVCRQLIQLIVDRSSLPISAKLIACKVYIVDLCWLTELF